MIRVYLINENGQDLNRYAWDKDTIFVQANRLVLRILMTKLAVAPCTPLMAIADSE